MPKRIAVRVILGAGVLALVALGWFLLQVDPVFSSTGKEVIITVKSGESFASVAVSLHEKGVIASPFALRLESVALGAPNYGPGLYGFRQGSSFAAVRAILNAGSNVLDVTPGLTLHEVALNVADVMGNGFGDAFVKDATATVNPTPYLGAGSLEGLIGPGLYVLDPSMTAKQLLGEMVTSFDRRAARLGLKPTTSVEGLDAYQLVIAASIVEKEGYYPMNMPKVARVIYNRLARGGPLQMDATVLYYFNQDGGTVTPAMLQTRTPYNTYLNTGLTPTPICTISTFSIDAVLHAPPGPWLYFTLVTKEGKEAFSTTFAEQLANERLAASRGIS